VTNLLVLSCKANVHIYHVVSFLEMALCSILL